MLNSDMNIMSGRLLGVLSLVSACLIGGCAEQPGPAQDLLIHKALVEARGDYTAWPAVTRTADGSLLVLYTNTDEHMGPNGRIEAVRSDDDGKTWSAPTSIYDTVLDERESGITGLSDGSLLAHIWSTQHTPESYAAMGPGSYYNETVQTWAEKVASPDYSSATDLAGATLLRSTDQGRTWDKLGPGPDTIHGGIELDDGRIMVASYKASRDYVTVHEANDWAGPWKLVTEIRSPQPDSLRFGEPSIAQMPSGRIVVMMRTTTKPYNDSDDRCYLWEVTSADGGQSWGDPFQTPLWGFPPHLLVLDSGKLLVTYGHRRPPFGQRAAISDDGITWNADNEIVLRDDAPNKDLGYPASVQLSNGQVLTVYYQSHASDSLRPPEGPPPGRHKPDIWATTWTPPVDNLSVVSSD